MTMVLIRLVVLRSQLPETVASHFDGSGRADGWMDRDPFLLLMACTVLLTGGMFLAIGWLLRRLPVQLVNLPHRELWLGPERREATIEDLDRRLSWMGVATLFLLVYVVESCVWATRTGAGGLPPAALYGPLVLYLAVIGYQTVALLVTYSRRPSTGDSALC